MHPTRLLKASVTFIFLMLPAVAAAEQYTAKTGDKPPPMELKEPIRSLLASQSVQVLDAKGEVYCEIWFRKNVPVKASAEQVKSGLTYREVEETTLLGGIRFAKPAKDYRKQKIKPGVYTLRLAFQPQDGDHMGTAPYAEFCLLVAADKDAKPDAMDPKALQEASAKSLGGNHPGVLLLFPNEKPEPTPKLAEQEMHWIVRQALPASAEGKPAMLGIGLTVVGESAGG